MGQYRRELAIGGGSPLLGDRALLLVYTAEEDMTTGAAAAAGGALHAHPLTAAVEGEDVAAVAAPAPTPAAGAAKVPKSAVPTGVSPPL